MTCDTPSTTVSRYSFAADGTIESYGGIFPAGPTEVARNLRDHGHAITGELSASGYRERFRAHDDARFCESRGAEGSMAAYYENGDAIGGRSWINDVQLRRWLSDQSVA